MSDSEPVIAQSDWAYAHYVRLRTFWGSGGRRNADKVDQQLGLLLAALQPLRYTNEMYQSVHNALFRHQNTWNEARNYAEYAWEGDDSTFVKNQWMKRCMEKLQPFHDELCKKCQTMNKVATNNDPKQNSSDGSQALVYGGLTWALNILKDDEEIGQLISNNTNNTSLISACDLQEIIQSHIQQVNHGETDNELPAIPKSDVPDDSDGDSLPGLPDVSRASSPTASICSTSTAVSEASM